MRRLLELGMVVALLVLCMGSILQGCTPKPEEPAWKQRMEERRREEQLITDAVNVTLYFELGNGDLIVDHIPGDYDKAVHCIEYRAYPEPFWGYEVVFIPPSEVYDPEYSGPFEGYSFLVSLPCGYVRPGNMAAKELFDETDTDDGIVKEEA